MSDEDSGRAAGSPDSRDSDGCFAVLAILAGIILLLPGACLLGFAFQGSGQAAGAPATIGGCILFVAAALYYAAWRSRAGDLRGLVIFIGVLLLLPSPFALVVMVYTIWTLPPPDSAQWRDSSVWTMVDIIGVGCGVCYAISLGGFILIRSALRRSASG